MKYYIIAGEASGDLHGSNLIKALKEVDSDAEIRCWGGDLMQNAGGILVKHYKEMAFMGFLEVLLNLRAIFKNIAFCKDDIEAFQPHVIICIDYSGFNLKIAEWAKKKGFRTQYYISPQVWASRAGRIKKIKRDIEEMYVILPFEKKFYQTHGFQVHFVGHPLIDAIADLVPTPSRKFRMSHGLDLEKPIIALLPGSRKQEVQKMLNVMLSVVTHFKDYQFVIAGAPSLDSGFYQEFLTSSHVGFVENKTYELLQHAHAALVTSGTATLETALFNVPQVVCYKANWLSYQIAKRIITLKYISLVNLIMDKEVVKELIQEALNTENLSQELTKILTTEKRMHMLASYQKLKENLGGKGASKNAAELIFQSLAKENHKD
jgi:lipid-A-disaccharide synthase